MLGGSRWRSGRDHRSGREREARPARSPALRQERQLSSNEDGRAIQARALAPHSGGDPARGAPARRGALSFRGRGGSSLPRAPPARVPPPSPLWHGRRPHARERALDVPNPQSLSGRARLRTRSHSCVPDRLEGGRASQIRPRGGRRAPARPTRALYAGMRDVDYRSASATPEKRRQSSTSSSCRVAS